MKVNLALEKSITSNACYMVINEDLYIEITEQQFNSIAKLLCFSTK